MTLPAFPGRSLLAFAERPAVLLTSPHPPAECGRRLESVTGRIPWNVAGFEKRSQLPLQGQVNPQVIRVARTRRANRRTNLDARFIGRIEHGPNGGTLLVGTIGPDASTLPLLVVFPVAVLLIGGGFIAAGLWQLGSGQLHLTSLFRLIVPVLLIGAYVRTVLTGPAKALGEVQALLDELNTILDSTADFPDGRSYASVRLRRDR